MNVHFTYNHKHPVDDPVWDAILHLAHFNGQGCPDSRAIVLPEDDPIAEAIRDINKLASYPLVHEERKEG